MGARRYPAVSSGAQSWEGQLSFLLHPKTRLYVYLSEIWDLHRISPYWEQFRSDNERRSPDWQREQRAISAL